MEYGDGDDGGVHSIFSVQTTVGYCLPDLTMAT